MKKELLHIILIALCLPMGLKAQTNTITTATVNLLCSADYNNDHWTYCYPLILNAQEEPVSASFTLLPDGINATFDYDSLAAPYSIILDYNCTGGSGEFFELDSSTYSGYSTTEINNELHYTHLFHIDVCENSGGNQEPIKLFTLVVDYNNCEDALINCPATLYKDGFEEFSLTGSGGILIGGHPYDPNSSYTLHYDQTCLEALGVELPQYIYQLYPQYSYSDSFAMNYYQSFTIECTTVPSDTIDPDSCGNLYTTISPYSGYYQNSTNYVAFSWNSTFSTAENVIITIDLPQGVILAGSWGGNIFTQTGNQLTLNTTIPANTGVQDILAFNVPGGINDGILHTYSITISPVDTLECTSTDNTGHLDMIVGNSYDPNDKTVNLPTTISPNIQDEFLYTIRFQNTGTAPAQDVYIDDTLSYSLDWSTFDLIESSHPVEVIDLGNGVIRFNYEDIWLPDSTSNLFESMGYVSFKIKENATNGEGSEIFNTAYIYFDHNPAIITNTTYNINTDKSLDIEEQKINNIVLFPNPASSVLNITSDFIIDKIEIYDVTGKLCLKDTFQTGNSKTIPIHHFDAGIYFLTIQTGAEESMLRFIKK